MRLRHRPLLTSALLLAAAAATPAPLAARPVAAKAEAGKADRQLRALYEGDWAWSLADQAQIDDGSGRARDSDHLPSVTPAAQARRLAHWRETLAALDRIPAARLSAEEKVNAAVFRTNLQIALSHNRFHDWEMPFNSDSAFWTDLTPRDGFANAAEYRRYLGRLRDLGRYFGEQIANMRVGLARGFTPPAVTLAGRDKAIEPYVGEDVEKNPLYAAFLRMPANIPAAEQERLRGEARAAIREVAVPAYRALLHFLRDDYLPRARSSIAATALPDGDAYYRAQVKEYTTTDLTPEQIHQIGLSEVARIEGDMRKTIAAAGFQGDIAAFSKFLKTDPRFQAKSPDELLGVSAYVAKRVDGKLGQVLGLLPRRRFTIIPVPDDIAPFYTSGRGGLQSCLMNTYDLPSRPLYNIPALTLHECSPGHSLQAALASEQQGVPAFRRNTYFSGYGEGWGLYCEWLGEEMGIYRNPYEEFGRESYEMWRAVRLVIDTGIHLKGWSRSRAIDYLAAHTALSDHEVQTEVDRYISWPGQALAYKLGEMTIRRLRAKAEAELGPRFDERKFHDAILALGSVPLPVLEERIGAFIAEAKARKG